MPRINLEDLDDQKTNEEGNNMRKSSQPKTLENGSIFEHLDADGDGVITDEEMARAKEIAEFKHKQALRDNEDKKEDQIRAMAWFALWGMLLYPVLSLITSFFSVDGAAQIIGDIAPTYFIAIAGLVAAFFGAQAYTSANKSNDDEHY
jgi:hypothetical protein